MPAVDQCAIDPVLLALETHSTAQDGRYEIYHHRPSLKIVIPPMKQTASAGRSLPQEHPADDAFLAGGNISVGPPMVPATFRKVAPANISPLLYRAISANAQKALRSASYASPSSSGNNEAIPIRTYRTPRLDPGNARIVDGSRFEELSYNVPSYLYGPTAVIWTSTPSTEMRVAQSVNSRAFHPPSHASPITLPAPPLATLSLTSGNYPAPQPPTSMAPLQRQPKQPARLPEEVTSIAHVHTSRDDNSVQNQGEIALPCLFPDCKAVYTPKQSRGHLSQAHKMAFGHGKIRCPLSGCGNVEMEASNFPRHYKFVHFLPNDLKKCPHCGAPNSRPQAYNLARHEPSCLRNRLRLQSSQDQPEPGRIRRKRTLVGGDEDEDRDGKAPEKKRRKTSCKK